MRSAVVTVVAGRHRHLLLQRRTLGAGTTVPDLHVVVSMGDPGIADAVNDASGLETLVLDVAARDGRLPLAAARNAGFAAAIASGADVLIGLDVDCLADEMLVDRYLRAAVSAPVDALLCGAVTYLQPSEPRTLSAGRLAALRSPHPARPVPATGVEAGGDHALFWSLSFAVTARTWLRIGGFDEAYRGYGAEDTDFGQRARRAGVPLTWVGDAHAYHQHHPTASPPVQHLDDLLANAAVFAARWGWWPMHGWFDQLAAHGMVKATAGGWARADPVRLLTIPAQHPYIDAIRPSHVQPVAETRSTGWAPDPALDPEHMRALAEDCDIVHVHFGYDHLSQTQLRQWLDVLDAADLPLVVTVHDLRNPHHRDRERHDAHLALLLRSARQVMTLTPGAAAAIESTFGVQAAVTAHPTLLDHPVGDRGGEPGLVAVHLKSLRANVAEPERIVRAALAGARRGGGRLQVDLHPQAREHLDPSFVRSLANAGDVKVSVHERFNDEELNEYLAVAHVSVLPYRFGTHSGWLELCRDAGTRVVAPDCGFYADQWADVVSFTSNETAGLNEESLSAAVAAALATPPPAAADWEQRRLDRELIRMEHARLYATVLTL